MNNNPDSDLPLILLIAGAVFLFVGLRALITRRILRSRSGSEYVGGKKARVWGWIYLVVGIGCILLALGSGL